MANLSFYEQLCQKKTLLYPNGVQNSLQTIYARQAEFGREVRKPLQRKKKAQK